MARRPRPTVSPSRISAPSTNAVMTSAVKNSPIAKRGDEGDGHGKFHRHAAFDDVLECFFEDGIAANQRGRQSDHADPMKRLPQVEPDRCCRERDEDDTENLGEFKAVFVVMIVFGRYFAAGCACGMRIGVSFARDFGTGVLFA